MKYLTALLCACALFAAAASAQQEGARSKLTLHVFDNGRPVSGLAVLVDGDTVTVTDATGGAVLEIPSGRNRLQLLRDGEQVLDLDLLTARQENVQILATLKGPGESPVLDIQSSTGGPVLAAEQSSAAEGEGEERQQAQAAGLLKGRIVSVEKNAPVPEARIFVAGQSLDLRTDAQGRFAVELPPGNYTLSVVHADFATRTLDNIRVIPAQTVEAAIELTPAGVELQEYVVTAPYVEGSVASVLEEQRQAYGVSEVLGAEQMAKAGDSTAADAVKRTTGLTLEDGKYVVVRGQPSRYTMTLWNGSPLPSPDPIRQVVPLDMFPSSTLSDIQVQKGFLPDAPGSFGGGLIELNTRRAPDAAFFKLSGKLGVNSQSFGEDGLTYEGGDTDWLGDDDGARALPAAVQIATAGGDRSLSGLSGAEMAQLGRSFPNNYQVTTESLPPDLGFSLSGGGKVATGYGTYGALASLSYSRNYRYREQIERDYAVSGGELDLRNDYVGRRTDMNVGLGAMLTLSGEWDDTTLTSNTFFVRDTTDRAEITEGDRVVSDTLYVRDYLLEWNQREQFIQQFLGEHELDFMKIDWRVMSAEGTRTSPDRREYMYILAPNDDWLFYEETGIKRRYNDVEDSTDSAGVDLTIPVVKEGPYATVLKTGYATYEQERLSLTQRFRFEPTEGADITPDNPEEIFAEDAIGYTVEFNDDTQSNDDYRGSASVDAYYLMADALIADELRIVGGVRREQAEYRVRTFQGAAQSREPVTGGFEQADLLPGVSATWFMNDEMQLRASYGKSVSRPLLNELSAATYYDPDTGDEYLGNPDLQPTEIDGYELRWEWYPSTTEVLNAGLFAKDYANPIEQGFISQAGGGYLITVTNADSASVVGVELGYRTGLERFWERMAGMYLQGNVAFVDSQVELSAEDAGVATNSERQLQGQAPYVLNLQAGYEGERYDWMLSFNSVGERLTTAGVSGLPDVFLQPVHYLDFTLAYRPLDWVEVGFSAENLLDPEFEYLQGGEVYRSYSTGRTFAVEVEAKF